MKKFPFFRPRRTEPAPSAPARSGYGIRFFAAAALLLLIGLVAGFYLFFPTSALKDRLEHEVTTKGTVELAVEDLLLLFPPALKVEAVSVKGPPPQSLELKIDSFTLKPLWGALLTGNPGVNFQAELYGGTAEGAWKNSGSVETRLRRIAFKAPVAPGSALSAGGVIEEGTFSGAWPIAPETETSLTLTLNQAAVSGLDSLGAATGTLSLGTLTLQGSGRGRSFKIDRLENQGGDLQVSGGGTLLFTEPVERSRLNLTLTLNPAPTLDRALVDLLGIFVKPDREGRYRLRISGTLGNPIMR